MKRLIIIIFILFGCGENPDNSHEIANLQDQIDQIRDDFANQPNYQDQLNELTVRVAELETNSPVIEIIDPCGDGVGFDEIILRLGTGELIAYFQHGAYRFLTVLGEGDYQTTDMSRCRFSVDSNGSILD